MNANSEENHYARDRLNEALKYLNDLKYAIDQSMIVSISNPDGTIIYANELMTKMSGYTKAELIGKNHRILNSGYHSVDFFSDLWKTVSSGKTWHGEIRNKNKSGSFYWSEATIVPFMGNDGKPYQYMAIRKDITARKLVQAELEDERSKRINTARLSAIGEMASSIAHEIKNPLTAISLRAQLLKKIAASLKEPTDTEKVLSNVTVIETTAKRITSIIHGLQTFSRDGHGDPFEIVPVEKIVMETTDFCKNRLEIKNIKFETIFPTEQINLECRFVQITQILLNLINNSSDAIEGLECPWIQLRVSHDSNGISFSVSDSGPGVPVEIRNRLMEPFFTTKPVNKGTGLGLSISRTIAAEHHGNLHLDENAPYTTFTLSLPYHHRH